MSARLPMLQTALLVALAGCDAQESQDRYSRWSESIATIPLRPETERVRLPVDVSDDRKPLKIELLTPHQLWDARSGPLDVPSMKILTAPAVSELPPEPITKAASSVTDVSGNTGAATVQLGAFSSEAMARAAWERLIPEDGGSVLSSVEPSFQPVTVNGRQFVRLRIRASAEQARSLCLTLASADPWCQKPSS